MSLIRFLKLSDFAFALMGILIMAPRAGAQIPQYDHVAVVIMENHNYGEILGPPGSAQAMAAPYINSLTTTGALFTNSHGIEHPSQPNYLDLFSGSNQGQPGTDNYPLNPSLTDPFATTASNPFTSPNLGASLFAAGFTFKTYSEDLPEIGSLAQSNGPYQHKHNPSANWQSDNPAPATNHTLPASANVPFFTSGGNLFFGDAASTTDFSGLPTVSFVVPNQLNDMHDGTIQMGDTWLSANIEAYRQWALTHNSLLILTFDEGSEDPNTPVDSAENRIVTIFAGQNVIPGQYGETITHFTILRTLEDMYGLPTSGPGDLAATPITDVFTLPPLVLLDAASRKMHGSLGPFDIDLPLTDNLGIECRSGGTNNDYTMVLTFTNPVTSVDSANTNCGSVSGSMIDGSDAHHYIVNLTGVVCQEVTVTLTGVHDNQGSTLASASATMSILVGDTTANGIVNSSDISQTKSQSGQTVTDSNFREDVTVNGVINSSDISLVKSRSGTATP
jgi:hypothetical protein